MSQGQPPRTLADQNVIEDAAAGDVNYGNVISAAQGDEGGFAITGYQQVDGGHLVAPKTGRFEDDIARSSIRPRVDDVDLACQFGGNPKLVLVRRQSKTTWPCSNQDISFNCGCCDINYVNNVGGFGRDIDGSTIRCNLHTFRLLTEFNLGVDLATGHVYEGGRCLFFVRDVERLAIWRQIEGFRLVDAAHALHQFCRRRIVDDDDVIVGTTHIKLFAVEAEMHATRPLAGLETTSHFVALRVENCDGTALFVSDVDTAATSRMSGGR